MRGACSVRLLGTFDVSVNGQPVPAEAWRHRRGADLVKLLALAPGHRLHREEVQDALWPGLDPAAAAANLRKALHYARRALGSNGSVAADRDLVELWPRGELAVDCERFESAGRAALARGQGRVEAARLYAGELLPGDRYADWAGPRREQLRQLGLDLWRSAERWEEVLDIDRADEEAHRALMRRHLAAGHRQAAIRQFYRLRDVLRVDLGVAPDEETVALFEAIVAERGPLLPTAVERAQARIARGLLAWSRGQLDEAGSIAQEVRALAIDHGLARELGEASVLLGMTAFAESRWQERFRAEFETAVTLDAEAAASVIDAHLCLAEASVGSGDPDVIAEFARGLLTVARDAESIPGQALATLLLGTAELAAGRLSVSEGCLRDAVQLGHRAASAAATALALVHLAEVETLRGRRRAALDDLGRAQPLAEASTLAPHLVARVYAGRLKVAETDADLARTLAAAEAALRPGEVCGPCSIGLQVNAVLACARTGEVSRARHCLDLAERLAGMWRAGPWQAAAWEARSAVRAAEGDRETAAALLHEARDLFAASGRRLDAIRCEQAAARLSTPALA